MTFNNNYNRRFSNHDTSGYLQFFEAFSIFNYTDIFLINFSFNSLYILLTFIEGIDLYTVIGAIYLSIRLIVHIIHVVHFTHSMYERQWRSEHNWRSGYDT